MTKHVRKLYRIHLVKDGNPIILEPPIIDQSSVKLEAICLMKLRLEKKY